MRMTNKIMQNNSLYNINQNKILQDKLSTQMSTNKKLARPSDDPVVAIRALRLRSSVSEISQYYEKNAPDADSWLKVTADGLGTVTDILTDLSKNANKGANKDLTADDLDIIITQMRSLSDEFYSTGNLDYAGRYVFTGYRTDTATSFTSAEVSDTKNPIPDYAITEQFTVADFDTINHTDIDTLSGITSANIRTGHDTDENKITSGDFYRFRLAYDNVSAGSVSISLYDKSTSPAATTSLVTATSADADTAYAALTAANEADTAAAYYIPETGEILLSNKAYFDNIQVNDDAAKKEFRVTYTKTEWKSGDLRPEHYFQCKSKDVNTGVETPFNNDYLDDLYVNKKKQSIEYDVGYNQTIEINTTADEVFDHGLARDVSDLEAALKELSNIEEIKKTIKNTLEGMDVTDADYDKISKQYDAANKAYTFIREKMHDMMQRTITKMQSYLDASNVAVTDNGTRSSRLELISNRLMDQKTTFKTLQSDNEDIDIAEAAVSLTSAEMTYNSSLMATGKIMQTSLMNYI